MAKQTVLLGMIAISLIFLSSEAFGVSSIQTAQHIIIIDPGHGGDQNGLVSSDGLTEKTITLKLARSTAKHLEPHYNVHLTRTSDTNMSQQERMLIANTRHADLFISIHLNNSTRPAAFFYYYDLPNEYASPEKKQKTTWISSPLFHQTKSKQLARLISSYFQNQDSGIATFVRNAPVFLLEGSTMPAVLAEPFSVSALPRHPARMEIIIEEYALRIAKAIDLYFNKQ